MMAERNSKIIALRKNGLFPWEIADQLGVTRNTVIGVVYRAGLSEPGNPKNGIASRLRNVAKPKANPGYRTPRHIRKLVVSAANIRGATIVAEQWGFHRNTVRKWQKEAAQ